MYRCEEYVQMFITALYEFKIIISNIPQNKTTLVFKGTHTVYFSSSLYIINQKPMIPRTHFHCITT